MAEVKVIGEMDNSEDHTFESANRVYDTNGVCPTINTCQGGGLQPKIVQKVCIRQATNKGYIECEVGGVADFSYPNSKLRRGRVQGGGQICPTLTAGEPNICRIEPITTKGEFKDVANTILAGYERTNMTGFNNDNAVLVGGLGEMNSNGGTQYYQHDRVYDSDGIAPAHQAQLAGGSYKYMVKEKTHQQDAVQDADGVSRTLVAGSHGNADTYTKTVVNYRIRKLTPKECFRLMGVWDEDYEKLTVSNSQKYKQAGNSIVVDVLMAIFENMFINECKSSSLI